MNRIFEPNAHPDADLLSSFVEDALTARERGEMLAHLAACRECRDVVFLMQQTEETEKAAPVAVEKWRWARWLVPAGLAGAALACGLTAMVVYVRIDRRAPVQEAQMAAARQPQNPTAGVATDHAASAQPEKQTSTLKPGAATPKEPSEMQKGARKGAELPAAANAGGQLAAAAAEAPVAAATQAAAPANSVAFSAEAGAARAASPMTPAAAPQLPVNGRNLNTLQAVATPAGARPATAQDNSAMRANLPALKIANVQDATLSGVSGRVTDASGAVVPRATVALRDAAGATRQTVTGADGSFQLTGVAGGRYDLTVAAQGFERSRQSIDLKAREMAVLQPTLKAGTATESVEVASSGSALSTAPALETEAAGVGPIAAAPPGSLPVAASISAGKVTLSLDGAGSLFLSRNGGKSWKKIRPTWSGKAIRIELAPTGETVSKSRNDASGSSNSPALFRLTTDSGAVWTSKDGSSWRLP